RRRRAVDEQGPPEHETPERHAPGERIAPLRDELPPHRHAPHGTASRTGTPSAGRGPNRRNRTLGTRSPPTVVGSSPMPPAPGTTDCTASSPRSRSGPAAGRDSPARERPRNPPSSAVASP